MNPLVCMPLYHWLSWVAGIVALVAVVVGTPIGILCAYSGAKLAIRACAKQQGCAMRISREKAQTTQDLSEQIAKMRAENPELAAIHEAARKALEETGNHPAIPERHRAKEDKDRDGQK